MTERVSVYEGKLPVLVIAPHGPDDRGTAEVAEQMIKSLNCYGVINRGWRSASYYDYDEQFANCNNITHIHEDVVKHEFLLPILRYQIRMRKDHAKALVVVLHSVGSEARQEAKDSTLDIIIGYGAGKPPAYTCDLWRKDYLVHCMEKGGLNVYEAKPRSKYAARNKDSLNQLFNVACWYPDKSTNSVQIQIIDELLIDEMAFLTGDFLSDITKNLLRQTKPWVRPINQQVKLI